MEVTVKQLNESSQSFAKLLGLSGVPANVRVRLARVAKRIEEESKTIQEQRLELFKKYGKQIEGKEEWTIEGATAENVKAFRDEEDKLFAEILPLPGKQIPFESISGCDLNAADILRLSEWLIELPAEEETKAATATA